MKRKEWFEIAVYPENTHAVPYTLFSFAEKYEIRLSKSGRLCGIGSKSVAEYENEASAMEVISQVKDKFKKKYGEDTRVESLKVLGWKA